MEMYFFFVHDSMIYWDDCPENQNTASQMHVAPRISVHCCPLLTICPRCCPRHAPDMNNFICIASVCSIYSYYVKIFVGFQVGFPDKRWTFNREINTKYWFCRRQEVCKLVILNGSRATPRVRERTLLTILNVQNDGDNYFLPQKSKLLREKISSEIVYFKDLEFIISRCHKKKAGFYHR